MLPQTGTAKGRLAMRLCMALIPWGKRKDASGKEIDCDDVFERVLRPAASAANAELLRIDPDALHSAERLLMCDHVIALGGLLSPGVFYELGVREAVRPGTTIILSNGELAPGALLGPRLILRLGVGANGKVQGPVFEELAKMFGDTPGPSPAARVYELVEGRAGPGMLDHLKTDVVRERLRYSAEARQRLKEARSEGAEAVRRVA